MEVGGSFYESYDESRSDEIITMVGALGGTAFLFPKTSDHPDYGTGLGSDEKQLIV